MDTGMNSASVFNLDDRQLAGSLPLDSTLTIPEVIAVMDRILACEVIVCFCGIVVSLQDADDMVRGLHDVANTAHLLVPSTSCNAHFAIFARILLRCAQGL